jgi:hypothetical protein
MRNEHRSIRQKTLQRGEIEMSKGDKQRGNREAKKPKKVKEKVVGDCRLHEGQDLDQSWRAQEEIVSGPSDYLSLKTEPDGRGIHGDLLRRKASGSPENDDEELPERMRDMRI